MDRLIEKEIILSEILSKFNNIDVNTPQKRFIASPISSYSPKKIIY